MIGFVRGLVAAAGLMAVAACSQQGQGDEPRAATSEAAAGTVADSVAGSADHRTLAAALSDTQLASVLGGKGDYTLLAPSDAAFDALGNEGAVLSSKEQRPLMIAVLRGHVLPGHVTVASIGAAIARKQGVVEMQTMSGGTVRFSKDAKGGFAVSNGAQTASIQSGARTASNGMVLPIDKVLLPPQ